MIVFLKAQDTDLMYHNKVHNIKAIRNATRLGLKEAKELFEAVQSGNGQESIRLRNDYGKTNSEAVFSLQSSLKGIMVTSAEGIKGFEEMYGSTLRALASQAILSGNDGLANDLMETIKFYSTDV